MDFPTFIAGLLPSPDTVTITPYTGDTGSDPYGTPVAVSPCFVDVATKRRIQSKSGAEVRAEAVIYAPVGTVAPPWSIVLLANGTKLAVVDSKTLRDAGAGLPEHVEITCGQAPA